MATKSDAVKVPLENIPAPQNAEPATGPQKNKSAQYGATFTMCDSDGNNKDTVLHRG